MLLVDTTVWIDFFAARSTFQVAYMKTQLEGEPGQNIYLCWPIITEVLQGIRSDSEYKKIVTALKLFSSLEMTENTFVLAAEIYRKLRKQGVTIRKTIDCMIAATAIQHNVPLLHNDKDFEAIAQYYDLQTIQAVHH